MTTIWNRKSAVDLAAEDDGAGAEAGSMRRTLSAADLTALGSASSSAQEFSW
jgi:hypothetical protein